ncbi:hypothetical protein DPMN_185229 [Dreissena polymorpha]|uniref:Uncharacterized protein n=1 Tax=Dreissena polymorpha TaxID=45954 RepID=A0A9D4I856_DREPO|nr:hypothetical protein DPMN_185229 [Dreissena polymorpha]
MQEFTFHFQNFLGGGTKVPDRRRGTSPSPRTYPIRHFVAKKIVDGTPLFKTLATGLAYPIILLFCYHMFLPWHRSCWTVEVQLQILPLPTCYSIPVGSVDCFNFMHVCIGFPEAWYYIMLVTLRVFSLDYEDICKPQVQ